MAYLLQDLIRDHGWGRPGIVGTLLLPAVFTADVEQALTRTSTPMAMQR